MPPHSGPSLHAPLATRPLCVDAVKTRILTPPSDYAPLFAQHHAFECRDLLDPALLARLIERCDAGTFRVDHVEGIGSREIEAPQRVGMALNLALGRLELLRWVEAATGKQGLRAVEGRVVQIRANGTDGLDWHDDDHERGGALVPRLAITIGLSDASYEGGEFEMRRSGSKAMLVVHKHRQAGSALIFDIGTSLEHRVRPVLDGGMRRVFAGWFLGAAQT
jgi:hypothetical protein